MSREGSALNYDAMISMRIAPVGCLLALWSASSSCCAFTIHTVSKVRFCSTRSCTDASRASLYSSSDYLDQLENFDGEEDGTALYSSTYLNTLGNQDDKDKNSSIVGVNVVKGNESTTLPSPDNVGKWTKTTTSASAEILLKMNETTTSAFPKNATKAIDTTTSSAPENATKWNTTSTSTSPGYSVEGNLTSKVASPEVNQSEAQPTDSVDVSKKTKSSTSTSATKATGEYLAFLQSLGAITGRGEFASKQQKQSAVKALQQLERTANNETSGAFTPARSDLMLGTWELVYSSTQLFRSSPLFMAGRAVCRTEAAVRQFNWFCDMHRASLAISQIEAVRQIVSSDKLVSEIEVRAGAIPFLSDFTRFRYSGGLPVSITGALVSSADITATYSGDGLEVLMDSVEIKGSNVPVLRQILDSGTKLRSRQLSYFLEQKFSSYQTPKPIFCTTYLDNQFRISRDQDNNAFLYVKTSNSTKPTDYSKVDSDLGVARLLEGFNDAVTRLYL